MHVIGGWSWRNFHKIWSPEKSYDPHNQRMIKEGGSQIPQNEKLLSNWALPRSGGWPNRIERCHTSRQRGTDGQRTCWRLWGRIRRKLAFLSSDWSPCRVPMMCSSPSQFSLLSNFKPPVFVRVCRAGLNCWVWFDASKLGSDKWNQKSEVDVDGSYENVGFLIHTRSIDFLF